MPACKPLQLGLIATGATWVSFWCSQCMIPHRHEYRWCIYWRFTVLGPHLRPFLVRKLFDSSAVLQLEICSLSAFLTDRPGCRPCPSGQSPEARDLIGQLQSVVCEVCIGIPLRSCSLSHVTFLLGPRPLTLPIIRMPSCERLSKR